MVVNSNGRGLIIDFGCSEKIVQSPPLIKLEKDKKK